MGSDALKARTLINNQKYNLSKTPRTNKFPNKKERLLPLFPFSCHTHLFNYITHSTICQENPLKNHQQHFISPTIHQKSCQIDVKLIYTLIKVPFFDILCTMHNFFVFLSIFIYNFHNVFNLSIFSVKKYAIIKMLKRDPDRPCGNGRELIKLHRKQSGLQQIARILFCSSR